MNMRTFSYRTTLISILLCSSAVAFSQPINRHALVTRHNPSITAADPFAPFTVGNGEFAFTADVTGLQSFPDYYDNGIPLGTLSTWGWHTIPSDTTYTLDDAMRDYDTYGRNVGYASQQRGEAGNWLRANPHRLHLGRIGFQFNQSNNHEININDIENIEQTLDLWTGTLHSKFSLNGTPVQVTTVCHPERDLLAVRVESPLLEEGALSIAIAFPYGLDQWGPTMTDWNKPDRHRTEVTENNNNTVEIKRSLDADSYSCHISYSEGGEWKQINKHQFVITPGKSNQFEMISEFSPDTLDQPLPSASQIIEDSEEGWNSFWESGGAIDLGESEDPRAHELERRIVLSQYLTKINCSGSLPPQESGLTHNSWFGKAHLEMHWWHTVHFALWNRIDLMEKSLDWYNQILPRAKGTAEKQGYKGARWPKMVGPDGRESPSGVGVFLIWQQPHPIYYAELCYRQHPNRDTLERYKTVVFETAEFMASYAHWDESSNRYVLGPPLIPAQENYPPPTTFNPTFELAYWKFALERAQDWRRRLGMEPDETWQRVIDHISPLPMNDGVYVTTESTPDTFQNADIRVDHPSLVAALGILPGEGIADRDVMNKTLKTVLSDWAWDRTWGWDYPMMAMTAARVGEPELAIQCLLMDTPKNRFLPNGHCYQRENLPTYLPANGGLLTAVAMMAAGWDGAQDTNAPGFPKDGKWNVRWEGLKPMP